MKTQVFSSCLATKMKHFCDLRRLSGTDYHSQECLLKNFDTFLVQNDFSGPYLIRALVDDYMNQIRGLKPRTRSNHLSVIRQFCAHLSNLEPQCYVPERVRVSQSSYQPYLFSNEEIRLLRTSALELKPSGSLRSQSLSMLYGLLFVTGLRIGEALALNVEDFSSQTLFVRQGKFHKERLVPLNARIVLALEEYLLLRDKQTLLSSRSPLFVNKWGRRLSGNSARTLFWKILLLTGIYSGTGQRPQLHDLRHSFAVKRLLQWYRDGEDINERLPLLATYMGHVNIQSTQKYIHVTPQLQQEFYQRTFNYFKSNIRDSGGR